MKHATPLLPLATATLLLAITSGLSAQEATDSPTTTAGKSRDRAGRDAKLIERFDANGDGRLDDAERAAAREAMRTDARKRPAPGAAKGAEMRERILGQFDADKDGKLSDEERAAARKAGEERRKDMEPTGREGRKGRPAPGAAMEKMRKEALERFDSDGDGKLSETERAEMRRAAEERISQNPRMLERFDANGDGQLDETERAAAREAMQQKMKSGKEGRTPRRGSGKG